MFIHVKVLSLLLVATVLAGLISCVTSRTESGGDIQITSDVPEWWIDPPIAEDALYGVGSAKMSTLDNSRRTATARARADIAFQMEATIRSAITDYAQEAGVDDENQVINFVETISRQVTDTTLTAIRTEAVYQTDNGTVFALARYQISDFTEAASDAFVRNEATAFAEFKAAQALDQLNSELRDNPPQARTQQ